MNRVWYSVFLACLLFTLLYLSGCATVPRARVQLPEPEQSTPVPPLPPQPPGPTETSVATPPPVSQPPVVPPPASPPASPPAPPVSAPPPPANQAVVALLDSADKQSQAGNLDNAAAVLERALRLEPQNPLLWHRLAALRLQQGQYTQVISLAAKSNALAGHNRPLQANNWQLIAQAKDKLGDAPAARAARDRARQLQ